MKAPISMALFTALIAFQATAHAEAIPGVTFKASFGADAHCLDRFSWGGLSNTCDHNVEVVGSMVLPDGSRKTSINVFGNASWCYALSTGGNAYSAGAPGAVQYTTSGPDDHWNTLNTGDVLVNWNSTLLFMCTLEPGGIVGSAIADN